MSATNGGKTAAKHFKGNVTTLFALMQEGVSEGMSVVITRAVQETPEDTGASRANWQFVKSLSDVAEFNENKTGHQQVYNQAAKLLDSKTHNKFGFNGNEYYLANPTPYAVNYELGRYPRNTDSPKTTAAGFSVQAPKGVVNAYEKQDAVTLANTVKTYIKGY